MMMLRWLAVLPLLAAVVSAQACGEPKSMAIGVMSGQSHAFENGCDLADITVGGTAATDFSLIVNGTTVKQTVRIADVALTNATITLQNAHIGALVLENVVCDGCVIRLVNVSLGYRPTVSPSHFGLINITGSTLRASRLDVTHLNQSFVRALAPVPPPPEPSFTATTVVEAEWEVSVLFFSASSLVNTHATIDSSAVRSKHGNDTHVLYVASTLLDSSQVAFRNVAVDMERDGLGGFDNARAPLAACVLENATLRGATVAFTDGSAVALRNALFFAKARVFFINATMINASALEFTTASTITVSSYQDPSLVDLLDSALNDAATFRWNNATCVLSATAGSGSVVDTEASAWHGVQVELVDTTTTLTARSAGALVNIESSAGNVTAGVHVTRSNVSLWSDRASVALVRVATVHSVLHLAISGAALELSGYRNWDGTEDSAYDTAAAALLAVRQGSLHDSVINVTESDVGLTGRDRSFACAIALLATTCSNTTVVATRVAFTVRAVTRSLFIEAARSTVSRSKFMIRGRGAPGALFTAQGRLDDGADGQNAPDAASLFAFATSTLESVHMSAVGGTFTLESTLQESIARLGAASAVLFTTATTSNCEVTISDAAMRFDAQQATVVYSDSHDASHDTVTLDAVTMETVNGTRRNHYANRFVAGQGTRWTNHTLSGSHVSCESCQFVSVRSGTNALTAGSSITLRDSDIRYEPDRFEETIFSTVSVVELGGFSVSDANIVVDRCNVTQNITSGGGSRSYLNVFGAPTTTSYANTNITVANCRVTQVDRRFYTTTSLVLLGTQPVATTNVAVWNNTVVNEARDDATLVSVITPVPTSFTVTLRQNVALLQASLTAAGVVVGKARTNSNTMVDVADDAYELYGPSSFAENDDGDGSGYPGGAAPILLSRVTGSGVAVTASNVAVRRGQAAPALSTAVLLLECTVSSPQLRVTGACDAGAASALDTPRLVLVGIVGSLLYSPVVDLSDAAVVWRDTTTTAADVSALFVERAVLADRSVVRLDRARVDVASARGINAAVLYAHYTDLADEPEIRAADAAFAVVNGDETKGNAHVLHIRHSIFSKQVVEEDGPMHRTLVAAGLGQALFTRFDRCNVTLRAHHGVARLAELHRTNETRSTFTFSVLALSVLGGDVNVSSAAANAGVFVAVNSTLRYVTTTIVSASVTVVGADDVRDSVRAAPAASVVSISPNDEQRTAGPVTLSVEGAIVSITATSLTGHATACQLTLGEGSATVRITTASNVSVTSQGDATLLDVDHAERGSEADGRALHAQEEGEGQNIELRVSDSHAVLTAVANATCVRVISGQSTRGADLLDVAIEQSTLTAHATGHAHVTLMSGTPTTVSFSVLQSHVRVSAPDGTSLLLHTGTMSGPTWATVTFTSAVVIADGASRAPLLAINVVAFPRAALTATDSTFDAGGARAVVLVAFVGTALDPSLTSDNCTFRNVVPQLPQGIVTAAVTLSDSRFVVDLVNPGAPVMPLLAGGCIEASRVAGAAISIDRCVFDGVCLRVCPTGSLTSASQMAVTNSMFRLAMGNESGFAPPVIGVGGFPLANVQGGALRLVNNSFALRGLARLADVDVVRLATLREWFPDASIVIMQQTASVHAPYAEHVTFAAVVASSAVQLLAAENTVAVVSTGGAVLGRSATMFGCTMAAAGSLDPVVVEAGRNTFIAPSEPSAPKGGFALLRWGWASTAGVRLRLNANHIAVHDTSNAAAAIAVLPAALLEHAIGTVEVAHNALVDGGGTTPGVHWLISESSAAAPPTTAPAPPPPPANASYAQLHVQLRCNSRNGVTFNDADGEYSDLRSRTTLSTCDFCNVTADCSTQATEPGDVVRALGGPFGECYCPCRSTSGFAPFWVPLALQCDAIRRLGPLRLTASVTISATAGTVSPSRTSLLTQTVTAATRTTSPSRAATDTMAAQATPSGTASGTLRVTATDLQLSTSRTATTTRPVPATLSRTILLTVSTTRTVMPPDPPTSPAPPTAAATNVTANTTSMSPNGTAAPTTLGPASTGAPIPERTATATVHRVPEPPAAPLPAAVEEAAMAVGVSSSTVVGMASPGAAMQVTRSLDVLRLVKFCALPAAQQRDKMSEPPEFPRSLLPMVQFGPAFGQHFRGAVVVNILAMPAAYIAAVLIGTLIVSKIKSLRPRSVKAAPLGSAGSKLSQGERLARMPGFIAVVFGVGVSGTASSAMILLLERAWGGVDVALGVYALIAVFGPPIAWMANTERIVRSGAVEPALTSLEKAKSKTLVLAGDRQTLRERALRFFLVGDTNYFPTAPADCDTFDGIRKHVAQLQLLERHGLPFMRYRAIHVNVAQASLDAGRITCPPSATTGVANTLRRHFFMIETVSTVVAAMSLGSAVHDCEGAAWGVMFGNLIALLGTVLLRPYNVPVKSLLATSINVLSFGGSVLALSAIVDKGHTPEEKLRLQVIASRLAAVAAFFSVLSLLSTLARLVWMRASHYRIVRRPPTSNVRFGAGSAALADYELGMLYEPPTKDVGADDADDGMPPWMKVPPPPPLPLNNHPPPRGHPGGLLFDGGGADHDLL